MTPLRHPNGKNVFINITPCPLSEHWFPTFVGMVKGGEVSRLERGRKRKRGWRPS